MDAYMGVKKNYTWEKAASIWENYLDSVEPLTHEETWDSKPRIHKESEHIPEGLNNQEFVSWAMENIAGQKQNSQSYIAQRLLRDLNSGATLNSGGSLHYNENSYLESQNQMSQFSIEQAIDKMKNMCEYNNAWEHKRTEISNIVSSDKNEEVITDSYSALARWDAWRPEFLKVVKPDENNTNAAD